MGTRARQRGATVVEAAIVAAIGTTLLAAASPEVAQYVVNSQLRSAADGLRSALRTAQLEALARQVPVELVLTDDEPRDANVTPRAAGRNWVVRAAVDGRYEWIRGFSGADRAPRVHLHSARGTFAFDAFGRLRDDGNARRLSEDGWRISVEDRESIGRPLRVVVTPGGSSTACDPAAAPGDSYSCG